jgi:5-methylthioadenosine/S-adenosylhomocysteine deaminase
MDANGTVVKDGAVYVNDSGRIESVQEASASPPAGFAQARRITTGGVIYPGLIDLHSHLGYNALPLFVPPKPKYADHDQWNRGDAYSRLVSWPSNVFLRAAPEASLKYAQVKALVGGTTAIQGKPKASRTIDGWLVRIIDDEQFGLPGDFVHVATIPKGDPEQLIGEARRLSPSTSRTWPKACPARPCARSSAFSAKRAASHRD